VRKFLKEVDEVLMSEIRHVLKLTPSVSKVISQLAEEKSKFGARGWSLVIVVCLERLWLVVQL